MTEFVWVADLEFVTEHAPADAALQEMAGEGERWEWSVSALGPRPGTRVLVYLDESAGRQTAPVDAIRPIVEDVAGWVDKHLPDAALASVRMVTEQQLELEALTPAIPELVAASDIAELLGITRQRVWQLAKAHPQFPAPTVRVSSGPLWTRDAIDWFASVWERKPGRPQIQRTGTRKRTHTTVTTAKVAKAAGRAMAKASPTQKPRTARTG